MKSNNTCTDFINRHKPSLIETITKVLQEAEENEFLDMGKTGLKMIRSSATYGKLIRGLLVLLSAEMHGVSIGKEHYYIAAAMEITHTGFLIQDDMMDKDILRRGQASVYSQYIQKAEANTLLDPHHFGASMSMCVGDIALMIAYQVISTTVQDKVKAIEMIRHLSRESQHVISAQMTDVSYGQAFYNPTLEEIYTVYRYKTAHYTFSLPLILGGIFSDKYQISRLKQIGEELGIIFQMQDDDLGIFGDNEKTGKKSGSDIRENKKTVLRFYLYEHADLEEKSKLDQIFGNAELTSGDIQYVQHTLEKYGIRAKIQHEIQKRNVRIGELLTECQNDGLQTDILQEFITSISKRIR